MADPNSDGEQEKESKPIIIRNTTDLQRLKLEKLMKNPDKPVIIPEKPKERGVPVVPDFVRNVMGSSAGAGSGEFHVYRHLRRKEYARQKYMKEKGERERLDNEYHQKLEENKKKAEERTAKKRQKRLKRKQKQKQQNKKPKSSNQSSQSDSTDTSGSETEETSEKDSVSEVSTSAGENRILKKQRYAKVGNDTVPVKTKDESSGDNKPEDSEHGEDLSRTTDTSEKEKSLESSAEKGDENSIKNEDTSDQIE